ncbi:RIP metalloprotease RseP [Rickettsiales bacterium]|nr:RIP metalloprotease RseP [Rickettsiales bacterium]
MELLTSGIYNVCAFVFILTIIVFSHEFGHYIIAKICGVRVEVFSIGFGKEIFGWNDKSGTRWKVSWLPLGGYVKMFGDSDPASSPDGDKIKSMTAAEKKVAFHTKPLKSKMAIVAAGPAANFILAIILLTFFFAAYGRPYSLPVASTILPDSAAAEAGMKAGDKIIEIDGTSIEEFSDMQRIIMINTGTQINMKIDREGQIIDVFATPKMRTSKDLFGNEVKTPLLGISSQVTSYRDLHAGSAFIEAIKETYHIGASTLKAIGQMVTGERSVREISGPIGIAKYSGQSVSKGLNTVLWFIVILSINLGLVNLFPIPALDGGHLLFYSIEAIQGRPLAEKVQEWALRIGISMIAILASFAIVNDFIKLSE